MPNIAQQDYIFIDIMDTAELTTQEKATIKEKVANNTILECLIRFVGKTTNYGRVVGVDEESNMIYAFDPYGATTVIEIDYSE